MLGDGHEVSILIRLADEGTRRARPFESFDDDHPPAATRTAPRRGNLFGLTVGLAQMLGSGFRRSGGNCRTRSVF